MLKTFKKKKHFLLIYQFNGYSSGFILIEMCQFLCLTVLSYKLSQGIR